MNVLKFGRAHTVSCRAVGLTIGQSGTLALGDVEEGPIADVHAIDLDTASVLPGMSNLLVTEPGVAIQGALFIIRVDVVKVFPADEVIHFVLHALMRQVVEV